MEAGWQTSYIPSSDGVAVAVHDFGPSLDGGDGPLVLVCHATGFCGLAYLPLIVALREQLGPTARIVAPDLRAHGMTGLPDGVEPAWRGMADDVTAVIDALSPRGPVLAFGHSMGGASIILAETARPGLIARTWCYEPILLQRGPVLRGEAAPPIAVGARARRARFSSWGEAYERYASRPPLNLLDPRALSAYVSHGFEADPDDPSGEGVILRCRPEWEASVFEHHLAGAYEACADLRIPSVFATSGDGGNAAQWVQSAAEEFPHLTLVSYPDLTHFGPLQEPDRLAVDVARFFRGDIGTEGGH